MVRKLAVMVMVVTQQEREDGKCWSCSGRVSEFRRVNSGIEKK